MSRYKIACFDMDGTLITNTNSVRYLCKINGKLNKVLELEKQEEKVEISWIKADYLKANLIKGLELKQVRRKFDEEIKLIGKIKEVVQMLKKRGIKIILVTAGPVQVAKVLGERFKFDKVYGSNFAVKEGVFTGNIIEHLGDAGKLNCLKNFCKENNTGLDECIAIGDSNSDVELFKECKKSIAINYSDALIGKADVYLKTENLSEILDYF